MQKPAWRTGHLSWRMSLNPGLQLLLTPQIYTENSFLSTPCLFHRHMITKMLRWAGHRGQFLRGAVAGSSELS